MNESTGINGEIRVLDEFVCTAICHDAEPTKSLGRGENVGFRMTTGAECSSVPRNDKRRRHIGKQLQMLVSLHEAELPPDSRRKIEEIIDRLDSILGQPNCDEPRSNSTEMVLDQLMFDLLCELDSAGFFNRLLSANTSLDQKAGTYQSKS